MNQFFRLGCLLPLVAFFLGSPRPAHAQLPGPTPTLPLPDTAKTFLDPVEMIVKSAPAGALAGLKAEPKDLRDLNRYFGQNIVGRSIVLHTKVEAVEPSGVQMRIRAASTSITWEGVSLKRLSYLYIQPADAPSTRGVAVGSEIIVTGWVRRCEVVTAAQGLQINFDLQYTKILNGKTSAAPASRAAPFATQILFAQRD